MLHALLLVLVPAQFGAVLPTEKAATIDARRDAVEALRRYFAVAPGELSAAGPLVRLLVHDGRAREAVSAARTFAALTSDSVWANLLLGLAFHAAREDADAQHHFAVALQRMDEKQRRAWADPRWLLDPGERSKVRRLPPAAREAYERKFWIASDPFWLTAANEVWNEHMARHAEARLLEDVPVVGGMVSWGADLHELTVRFGTATGRSWDDPGFGRQASMVEYFDSTSRNYVPDRWLNAGFPEPPLPGTKPLLYAAKARSSFGFRAVDRVLELTHQLTRFADGDAVVLRADAVVASVPDTVPKGTIEAGLLVYDSAFTQRREGRQPFQWAADSTRLTVTVRTAPGRLLYSFEALDTVARFGARARYALDAPIPSDRPFLSDILICEPFPAGRLPTQRDDDVLRALGSLVIAPGATVGIFAEVYRLTSRRARIELEVRPASGPGAIARLGRFVGVVRPSAVSRVAWTAEGPDVLRALAVNLPLDARRRGRFVLVLRVTDLETGRTAESRRPLLIQ
jgi:hypothetical protein